MKNVKKPQANTAKNDLPDSADDIKHLQPDEGTLDLPDVEDIPGQEHVRPLPAGEMADTTISSADEEGAGILDDDDGDSDVTAIERELLQESSESMASPDDIKLRDARVDNRDEDGTLLNERASVSGKDLDVPGSEDDDADEELGEEDEENNSYSLQDEKEDQNNGRE